MKKLLLFFLLVSLHLLQASPVDLVRARQVAISFLVNYAEGNNPYSSATALTLQNNPEEDGFYFFTPNGRVGFILISVDDAAIPVLGYSLDNSFPLTNAPVQVKKWVDNYSEQIEYIQVNHITADPTVRREWFNIEHADHSNVRTAKTTAVAPLITTTWDQGDYYNALCPYDASAGERVVTGCVATAMAQIIKYHSHPVKGTGFHSYSHPSYGTLSANFGNTTYNWGSMPNNVTSANSAVATLMYHCGVSVDMNYGVGSEGGSGAYPSAIAGALENYFGFDATAEEVNRSSYSESAWIALLKTELDNSRPMEYHGFGNGGGHSFVCDGYDNTNKFHYNWGWSGLANGYYAVNALNPTALGYGGGLGSYNSNQGIIKGIRPPAGGGGGGGAYALSLYSAPSLSSSSITYLDGVTLSTQIQNLGTADFTGDLSAAVFNSNGVFVEYIQVLTNQTLQDGFYYNVNFVSASLVNARPGDYNVYVYSRPTGGNWSLINGGSYTNNVALTVIAEANTEGLELASAVSPVVIIRNQSFSISTSVTNNDASNFSGYISLDLYAPDGSYIGPIEEKTFSVTAGNTASVTFNSTGIDEPAGDYMVAVWAYNTSWELVGSTLYDNPVYLQIKEAESSADAFENNNTEGNSYTLVPFAAGEYDTEGSNLHTGADLDYYDISLPSGTDYSIDARVHDSYNSGNGNTYSADVMFSYDLGSGYSSSYDDVLPDYIHVIGGGDVQFLVAPYFTGETGSYLLTAVVYEGIVDNTKDPSLQSRIIRFFPNPTTGNVKFEIPSTQKYSEINVYNAQGALVYTTTEVNGILSLEHMNNGIYTIELQKENGVADHAKVSVQK